ncbi:MAG: hypothetical protein ACXABY_28325, partial [Candidatus Thorarchaeota archaeon]
MSKYEEITDEDVIQLGFDEEGETGAHIACCDCGLVHLYLFSLTMNEEEGIALDVRVLRNQRSTGQLRRYSGGSLQRGECPGWEMVRKCD